MEILITFFTIKNDNLVYLMGLNLKPLNVKPRTRRGRERGMAGDRHKHIHTEKGRETGNIRKKREVR